MSKQTFQTPRSKSRIYKIMCFLRDKPASIHDVAAHVHLCYQGAYLYVRHLHQRGEIYIKRWDWTASSGPKIAVYAVGSRPDAIPPAPVPKATRERLRRARAKRENGETYQRMLNHAKAQKIQPRRDPAVAAVFGAVA